MKLGGKRVLLLIALTVLPATSKAQGDYGRFHALVIGNQNYRYLTILETPLADAEAVAEVLKEQYGFTVELLLDKSRAEILLAFARLRKTMTSEEDNLLIYYAGHGYLDVPTGTGYWQPVDAQTDNTVYWIPTDEITRLLRAIRARHVLVVADSCYSGSLLMRDSGARLPTGVERDEWLRRMQERRSRTALTSGGEEPVADGGGSGHSVFAKVFLEVLRENKGILDGDRLFDRIKTPVAANAEQTPFYGIIRMTNHDMGDFLLVPKALQNVTLQQRTDKVDLSWLRREADTTNVTSQPSTVPGQAISRMTRESRAKSQEGSRIGQYIDHGDGTITDTETGLMWKRCSEGLSGVNCKEGEVEKYTWDDAVRRFKDVEYAGYSDWRLPTIDELKTLVYCSKGKNKKGNCNDGSERPAINLQAFPNAKAEYSVWSGSPGAGYSGYAWYVVFNDGDSDAFYRAYGIAVRLVRGGQ